MENLLNNEPVKRVQKFIKKFNPNFNVIVLDTTARTAKDAANSLKCEVGAIVKSLLFKVENDFLICLIAGDRRCSLNKLKKILQKKDVSMANAEEVKMNTGFSIGGVAPVAHITNLDILVLKNTARTAKDAADSLHCEVGAIVKSLLFKAEDSFLICLIAEDIVKGIPKSLNQIKKWKI